MFKTSCTWLILLLCLAGCQPGEQTATTGGSDRGQIEQENSAPTKTVSEQISAVTDKYDQAMREFRKAYDAAESSDEQSRIARQKLPQPASFSAELLSIAQQHPGDADSFTAIEWTLQNGVAGDSRDVALKLLAANFKNDQRTSQLLPVLAAGLPSKSSLEFLEQLISQSELEATRGAAAMARINLYAGMIRYKDFLDNPVWTERIESMIDKDTIEMMNQVAGKIDLESMLTEVMEKYPDVMYDNKTIRELADIQLFELQNLQVGKQAPDIVANDLDGVEFKLSDYRGKVVLLDFWGDW